MSEEINEGLRILAERVKTNPEEFLAGKEDADKWWEAKRYLSDDRFPWTDEEKKIINDIDEQILEAKRKRVRDKFTSVVMKTLMDEPVELAEEEPQPLVKRKHVTKHEFDALKYTDPKLRQQLIRAMQEYRKEHGEL